MKKYKYPCFQCGKDTFKDDKDYYMVINDLWEKYGVGEKMLCMDCMEERLGHKVTKGDLTNCPVNTLFNSYTANIINGCENLHI